MAAAPFVPPPEYAHACFSLSKTIFFSFLEVLLPYEQQMSLSGVPIYLSHTLYWNKIEYNHIF